MTGSRTSSVKTLTESSGEGDGDGRGLEGSWLEIRVAASANKAATTRRPVVRFSQHIVEVGFLDARPKPTLPKRTDLDRSSLPGLGLDGGDGDGVDDVTRGAAAGEIVRGFVQALKNRSDRSGAR